LGEGRGKKGRRGEKGRGKEEEGRQRLREARGGRKKK